MAFFRGHFVAFGRKKKVKQNPTVPYTLQDVMFLEDLVFAQKGGTRAAALYGGN